MSLDLWYRYIADTAILYLSYNNSLQWIIMYLHQLSKYCKQLSISKKSNFQIICMQPMCIVLAIINYNSTINLWLA